MRMIVIGIVCVILLITMSAFFSGSETALVSLSRYRLKRLIIKNKALSGVFMSWLTSPQYILTTILIGNTIVNIAATSLATGIAFIICAGLPRNRIEIGMWAIMMIVILIGGEITPKIYSRRHAEQVSLYSIRPLYYITQVIKPLVRLTLWIMNKIAPGLYVNPMRKYSHVTPEELQLMITESVTGGGFGLITGEMMKKVLSLGELMPEKIMTKIEQVERVKFPAHSGDEEEWKRFYAHVVEMGHTRIPVYYEDNAKIEGYIHINDLVDIPGRQKPDDRSRLIRSGISITGKTKVSDLLKEFKTSRTHLAFVRGPHGADHGAHGAVRGIITLEDVLEAIVGEILDEFDVKKI